MNFQKLYILSAFLLAVIVSACIRLGNDAQTVADSIAEAVESKDFNRLAEIDEAFRASLSDDQETRREQRKALAELADDADNDTVRIATLLIAQLPDACGELLVNRLIESRTEGNTKETFLSTLLFPLEQRRFCRFQPSLSKGYRPAEHRRADENLLRHSVAGNDWRSDGRRRYSFRRDSATAGGVHHRQPAYFLIKIKL